MNKPAMPTQPTPAPEGAHTPKEMLASERWPLPWYRHNATVYAANKNPVCHLPCSLKTGETTIGAFSDEISGIVERGDIIETSCNRMSRRRNDWLERQNATLLKLLEQNCAHWDSVISSEGTEFSNGAFDSVKDLLADSKDMVSGEFSRRKAVMGRHAPASNSSEFLEALEAARIALEVNGWADTVPNAMNTIRLALKGGAS